MNKIKQYFWNLFVAIDQLLNAILLGDPDETVSSRFGKWMSTAEKGSFKWRIAMFVCMMLNWLDKNHCIETIENDEGKDDLLREFLKKRKK